MHLCHSAVCHPEDRVLCGPKDLWTRRQRQWCPQVTFRTFVESEFCPLTRIRRELGFDPICRRFGHFAGWGLAGCGKAHKNLRRRGGGAASAPRKSFHINQALSAPVAECSLKLVSPQPLKADVPTRHVWPDSPGGCLYVYCLFFCFAEGNSQVFQLRFAHRGGGVDH
jgi:hypothetical protein